MSKLDNLMKLQSHRLIGNTTFMLASVQFDRPAIFIFASLQHARSAMDDLIRQQEIHQDFVNRADATIGKVRFKTIDSLTDANYPYVWGVPVQIDHFALKLIIEEDRQEKERWIRDSEQNRIFTVARRVHEDFDAKAVMKLRKEWDELAEEHAQSKLREELKGDWKF